MKSFCWFSVIFAVRLRNNQRFAGERFDIHVIFQLMAIIKFEIARTWKPFRLASFPLCFCWCSHKLWDCGSTRRVKSNQEVLIHLESSLKAIKKLFRKMNYELLRFWHQLKSTSRICHFTPFNCFRFDSLSSSVTNG